MRPELIEAEVRVYIVEDDHESEEEIWNDDRDEAMPEIREEASLVIHFRATWQEEEKGDAGDGIPRVENTSPITEMREIYEEDCKEFCSVEPFYAFFQDAPPSNSSSVNIIHIFRASQKGLWKNEIIIDDMLPHFFQLPFYVFLYSF